MPQTRLDSWKAIAQYLGRDVTTVRRWEKREGLPVHRHLHDKLGSVYAYSDEIDAWSERRSIRAEPADSVVTERPQTSVVVPRPELRWWRLGLGLAGLAVIVIATISPLAPRTRAGADPVIRFAISPPTGVVVESLTISPDG